MKYTGTIIYLGEPKAVSDKFTIREIVISDPKEKYPQEVKMQTTQANCSLLDGYSVGDTITIHYNLRGRRYEKNGQVNWFNSIEIWKVDEPVKVDNNKHNLADAFDDIVPF